MGAILLLPPRPGSLCSPALNAETVRAVIDRRAFGLQSFSNWRKVLR
jgi:hypothetical protein